MVEPAAGKGRLYADIIERIFVQRWRKAAKQVEFHRSDIETVAAELGVALPKNLGDLIYSFRFRRSLPAAIVQSAPAGSEWIIELSGASTYRFSLAPISRIVPQAALALSADRWPRSFLPAAPWRCLNWC